MLPLGMIVAWLGYGVGSWGYCLIRGYDIPFIAWMSPLHSYQYPSGGPKLIPKGKLLPGSASAASGWGTGQQTTGPAWNVANPPALQQTPVGGPSSGPPAPGITIT